MSFSRPIQWYHSRADPILPDRSFNSYTDKKENQIFLMYKKIQSGEVAKSYMTNGLFIYGETFAQFLIFIRKPFLVYDFATAPL
jgi:hypothetical protein